MATDLARLHAVFDLAMRVGEGMLTNGAAASDVTSTVLRITSSSGIRNVAVQVTFDEVSLSYLHDDQSSPFTRIRAAGVRVQDFARLSAYEGVTESYIRGDVSLEEARNRAMGIVQEKPHYTFPLVVAGFAVMGGGAALSFGGDSLVVLAATLAAGLLTAVGHKLTQMRLPAFYAQAVGGLLAVLVAVGVSVIDPTEDSSVVVVACIIVLLAGLTSIGAMQDAVTGWYVTASARILETIMLTVGVVAGVRAGIILADRVGTDISVAGGVAVTLGSVVWIAVSGVLIGLGYGVGTYVPSRLLPWVAGVSAGSAVLSHAFSILVIDRVWTVAITATLAGIAAVLLARRLRAPALIFVMAGVIPLVPGSRIYRGLLALGDDVLGGTIELFNAASIALAIAAGAVFGQFVASRLIPARTRSAVSFTPVISAPFHTQRRRRMSLRPRRRRQGSTEAIAVPSTMTSELSSLPPELAESLNLEIPDHAVRSEGEGHGSDDARHT